MRHDPRRLDAAAYPWRVDLDTRFGDMDLNFHLNNVAVARLYEEGRVRFNWHLRGAHPVGRPRFVVAHVGIDYLGEGRYPAPASLAFAVIGFGTTSYRAGQALFQDGVCLGLCETVLVHRDGDKPAALPDALRTALGEFAFRP